jgi:hypothetical protein
MKNKQSLQTLISHLQIHFLFILVRNKSGKIHQYILQVIGIHINEHELIVAIKLIIHISPKGNTFSFKYQTDSKQNCKKENNENVMNE